MITYKYSNTAEPREREVIPILRYPSVLPLLLADSVVDVVVDILKYHYKMNFQ